MEDIYIFEGLSSQEIAYFMLMSESIDYLKGKEIIKEGDWSSDKAYIIESGSVDVFIGGEKVATLKKGELFGEMALITNEPRTATIITREETRVIAIRREEFMLLYKKSGNYKNIKNKILERIKRNFYGNKKQNN